MSPHQSDSFSVTAATPLLLLLLHLNIGILLCLLLLLLLLLWICQAIGVQQLLRPAQYLVPVAQCVHRAVGPAHLQLLNCW
jgi:hypothetical protein